MPNIDQARAAAKKRPSARSSEEQRWVEDNQGDQQVRNNDHEAKHQEKVFGPVKK